MGQFVRGLSVCLVWPWVGQECRGSLRRAQLSWELASHVCVIIAKSDRKLVTSRRLTIINVHQLAICGSTGGDCMLPLTALAHEMALAP